MAGRGALLEGYMGYLFYLKHVYPVLGTSGIMKLLFFFYVNKVKRYNFLKFKTSEEQQIAISGASCP